MMPQSVPATQENPAGALTMWAFKGSQPLKGELISLLWSAGCGEHAVCAATGPPVVPPARGPDLPGELLTSAWHISCGQKHHSSPSASNMHP